MHWRQFVLDEFVSSDITQEFLDNIRADLETIRSAKFTTIMRIMYTKQMPEVRMPYTLYVVVISKYFIIHFFYNVFLSVIFSEVVIIFLELFSHIVLLHFAMFITKQLQ